MKIVIAFLLCIIYLSLSIIVFSSDGGFLYKLKIDLSAYGWSEEEITSFMHAAQNMNWESIENGYVDVVAFSLLYCKRSGKKTTSEEKAELAYQLAIASSEMGAIGFKDDVITRIAVNASREFIEGLNQYRKKEIEDGLGEMIRQRIREQVCNEGTAAQQTELMERIRNRAGTTSNQDQESGHGHGHGSPH